ncbi:MAG: hypothetical protein GX780_08325 [Campylobacteraceae bacterium]|nr:hypothetical protein [Campylobacteraceae bacterium]
MKEKRRFYLLILAQAFAIVVVIGLIFADSITLSSWLEEPTVYTQQKLDCDLHFGPCEVLFEDGISLTLSIYPQAIPLMEPLSFVVKTEGFSPRVLKGKVYATNMNMGIHPITLRSTKNSNTLEGKIVLPTCLVGNMRWRVELIMPKCSDEPRQAAVFLFQTTR